MNRHFLFFLPVLLFRRLVVMAYCGGCGLKNDLSARVDMLENAIALLKQVVERELVRVAQQEANKLAAAAAVVQGPAPAPVVAVGLSALTRHPEPEDTYICARDWNQLLAEYNEQRRIIKMYDLDWEDMKKELEKAKANTLVLAKSKLPDHKGYATVTIGPETWNTVTDEGYVMAWSYNGCVLALEKAVKQAAENRNAELQWQQQAAFATERANKLEEELRVCQAANRTWADKCAQQDDDAKKYFALQENLEEATDLNSWQAEELKKVRANWQEDVAREARKWSEQVMAVSAENVRLRARVARVKRIMVRDIGDSSSGSSSDSD